MSEFDTTIGKDGESRTGQAKQMIGQAGEALKNEAQTFATAAQDKARAEAVKGTDKATKTLGDFANAIRRAGDELGASDQSPAARLVTKAADGLEDFSRSLSGKQPEDILNDVRGFARSHPAAFIGGAVLVGVALGRFVRASESNSYSSDYSPSLADEVGSPYPVFGAAGVIGDEALGDEAIGLADEESFDGDAEFSSASAGGIEGGARDDLAPSDADGTSGPLGGPRSL